MLYDPKWEVETKPDPFKMDTLIAWLAEKPAGEAYDYGDTGACLAAQYYGAMDCEFKAYLLTHHPALEDDSFGYKLEWLAREKPWSFGAALERARAAQALAEGSGR
jgi:hypothetical protein